jgi:hypothetical protein
VYTCPNYIAQVGINEKIKETTAALDLASQDSV